MSVVNIELLKKHVRSDEFSEDDDYLQHLLDVAEVHVLTSVNRTLAELTKIGGGKVPLEIRQAILLLAGHWYNQREAVSTTEMREVPYTLQALIKPYRKLSNRCKQDE
ncbi:head-tail connector protein [Porphyromonas cangingivalis]|uniref:head-tail connector protein n=1 Tax=Porphyromonas cangingivalis TaxID=36874 RepID=UPI0004701360